MSGQDVVIKLEPVNGEYRALEHEFWVYKKLGGGTGIPSVHWFGSEGGFNAMAIDRLGLSLNDIFIGCHRQFSVRTVLLITRQLVSDFYLLYNKYRANVFYVQISRLQYIHSRNFIHRDLKPSNLVMGVGKHADLVYLIDFGLSKEFRDPDTHMHIPYKDALGLTGTATFASIPSHLGAELGRRDDLESLAYILIYFLRGSLPWEGLSNHLIVASKQHTSTLDLCHGIPVEFRAFLEYARSLSFNVKPDYGYLSRLFDELSSQEGSDPRFDWDGQIDMNENVVGRQHKGPSKRRPG